MIYDKRKKILTVALAALMSVYVISIIILASVPPVSRDALTHHLAVPKLWIKHGGIYETPGLPFSYYPMNLDLLYVIPLYYGNDIIPKYIHFAFALATAWLIYRYLYAKLNRLYAFTGALFFLTTPVIVKLSITAYVDLGLIFFSTLSLLYLMKWGENGFPIKYLIVSAVSCGLAMGTKYNGLISFFLFAFLSPYIYIKWSEINSDKGSIRLQAKALGYGMLFVSIACILYLPWMAKNYAWTGNPLYPLFHEHIETAQDRAQTDTSVSAGSIEDEFNNAMETSTKIDSHFVVRKLVYGESWWETATIPLRVFFQGQDDNPKFFDGKLNPFLLLLPLFVFCRSNKYSERFNREIALLGLFAILYLLFVYFRIDMRIRWISPIVPPLVILSVIGLSRMMQFCDTCAKPRTVKLCNGSLWVIVTVMFILNGLYVIHLYKTVDPLSYLSGRTSRDAYIQRFIPEYSAITFANQKTPQSSLILCLFIGNRGYYSDRKLDFDYAFFKHSARNATSAKEAADLLKADGITHLMVRHDLFKKWHHDNFTQSEKKMISLFFDVYTETLYSKNGYTLLKIN